jgi:hypothetical protein
MTGGFVRSDDELMETGKGDAPMFTKSSIILSAAIVLGLSGGAPPALAMGYDYDGPYGGPTQTWCDVNPDCNGWNKAHRPGYQSSASGVVVAVPPNQKHHPSRKRSHDNR